jgi:integrase
VKFRAGQDSRRPGKGAILRAAPVKDVDTLHSLFQALEAESEVGAAAFRVCVGTALRAGDVLALTVDSCRELDDGVLVLREQKTEKVRRVVVHAAVVPVLRRRKERATRYLFEGQRGPITISYLNRLLKRAAVKVGLDPRDVKSHAGRKTAARLLYEGGTPLPLIVGLLGHSSAAQTLQYIQVTSEEERAALNSLPLGRDYLRQVA